MTGKDAASEKYRYAGDIFGNYSNPKLKNNQGSVRNFMYYNDRVIDYEYDCKNKTCAEFGY